MRNKSPHTNAGIGFRLICLALIIPMFILVVGCMLMLYSSGKPMDSYYYETTSIADYGKYIGNNDNGFALTFISSFFPQSMQDTFTDITYSYRAENFDIYGFEAYLEFTIEDEAEFSRYVEAIAATDEWHPFAFDPSYMEYSIADELELSTYGHDGNQYEYPHILEAEIGKVLYSSAEQKIIYVAIGVYDGGGITTEFLGVFFERFNIDPIMYLDKQ